MKIQKKLRRKNVTDVFPDLWNLVVSDDCHVLLRQLDTMGFGGVTKEFQLCYEKLALGQMDSQASWLQSLEDFAQVGSVLLLSP